MRRDWAVHPEILFVLRKKAHHRAHRDRREKHFCGHGQGWWFPVCCPVFFRLPSVPSVVKSFDKIHESCKSYRRFTMKRLVLVTSILIGLILVVKLLPASSQTANPRALTMALQCAGGDCPLLKGAPQTAGMRSSYVRLKPGETVGWHTTGKNEESLVILTGRGEARLEDLPREPSLRQLWSIFRRPRSTTSPTPAMRFWSTSTW